jgi:hypothetical protein
MESKFRKNLEQHFTKNCKGEQKCTLPVNYTEMNKECISTIENRALQSQFTSLAEKIGRPHDHVDEEEH